MTCGKLFQHPVGAAALRVGTHALAQITHPHTSTSGRQSRQRPRLQGASQSPRQGSRCLERPPARALRGAFAGKSRVGERGGRRERGARPRFYRGTAREARRLGTKPECALESVIKQVWYTSLLRIRIDDRRRRIGLVFWVQRHRYWTLDRAELLGSQFKRFLW